MDEQSEEAKEEEETLSTESSLSWFWKDYCSCETLKGKSLLLKRKFVKKKKKNRKERKKKFDILLNTKLKNIILF